MKLALTPSAACRALAALPVEQLSNDQLRQRHRRARQMVAFVVGLMLLVVVMAFVSGLYPLAITAVGMFAALDDYRKKIRALDQELRRRGLA